MDSRLLPRTHAYGLSIRHITDGIGLRELERNPGDEHIPHSRVGQVFALSNDICKVCACHRTVVAALLHAHAKDLTSFSPLRFIRLVNLDHSVLALLLLLEYLQGIRLICRSDHAI